MNRKNVGLDFTFSSIFTYYNKDLFLTATISF